MNSTMAAGIKRIGPKLTSTVSSETLNKKNKNGKLHSLVSYLSLKFDNLLMMKFDQRPRYERKYGWRNTHELRRKFKLSPDPTCALPKYTTPKKLEETDFFYVDGEPRSSYYNIQNFYRVYPYYEWDTTQIKDQMSNLTHCCLVAVRTHNQRTDDHLKFEELVSANMLLEGFPVYYFITFKAYIEGQSSSREYQTRALYWRSPEASPPPPPSPPSYEDEYPEAIINIQTFTPCGPDT